MNFTSATNYNFYKVFLAIYELGSITQASEQLFTATSTISYQIKELENQLNTKLFIPHPRGVTPTDAAIELYDIIKPAITAINNGESNLQDFNEDSIATLKIKFPTFFGSQIMSKYIATFKDRYKNVNFEVLGRKKQEGIELLSDGQIDLSFCTGIVLPQENDMLGVIVVKELTTTLFASKSFAQKYIKDNNITKEQLAQLPMVSLDKTYAVRGVLEKLGVITNPMAEVETTDIMLNLVGADIGIGYYVDEFISQNDEFVKINLKDIETPKFKLACVYNKKYCSKAAKAFISLLCNPVA